MKTPSGEATECHNENSPEVAARVDGFFQRWRDAARDPDNVVKAAGLAGGIVGKVAGGAIGSSAGKAAATYIAKKATGQETSIKQEVSESLPDLSGEHIGEFIGNVVGGSLGGVIGGLLGSAASEGIKQIQEVSKSKKSQLQEQDIYKNANRLQQIGQLAQATISGIKDSGKDAGERQASGAAKWVVENVTASLTGDKDSLPKLASEYVAPSLERAVKSKNKESV